MQRPTSRASDEHVIDINPEQPQPRPRRKTDSVSISSVIDSSRVVFQKISRSLDSKNWIQSVTAIAVLCFLILSWFSYPGAGNFLKYGIMAGGQRLDLPKSPDDQPINIAAVALSTNTTPPVAQNLAHKDDSHSPKKPSRARIKATKAFGYLGVILSGIGFLVQIPIAYHIIDDRRATITSVAPTLVSFPSCVALAWYGLPTVTPNNEALLIVNCIGAAMMLGVIAISAWYGGPCLRKIVGCWFIVMLGVFGVLIWIILGYKGDRKAAVGVVAMISNLSLSLIPFVLLVRFVRDRMPLPMPTVVVFFFSFTAMVWGVYGRLAADIYIMVPSFVGVIVTFLLGVVPHFLPPVVGEAP